MNSKLVNSQTDDALQRDPILRMNINRDNSCLLCQRRLSSCQNLRWHNIMMHFMVDQFPCQICGDFFQDKDDLTAHLTNQHLVDVRHSLDFAGNVSPENSLPYIASMTPAGVTSSSLTLAYMTPASMTPAGVTSSNMTPACMTPTGVTEACKKPAIPDNFVSEFVSLEYSEPTSTMINHDMTGDDPIHNEDSSKSFEIKQALIEKMNEAKHLIDTTSIFQMATPAPMSMPIKTELTQTAQTSKKAHSAQTTQIPMMTPKDRSISAPMLMPTPPHKPRSLQTTMFSSFPLQSLSPNSKLRTTPSPKTPKAPTSERAPTSSITPTSATASTSPTVPTLRPKCEICLKIFSTEKNRKRHLKTVHKMSPKSVSTSEGRGGEDINIDPASKATNSDNLCPICGCPFFDRTNVLRHMKNVHGITCTDVSGNTKQENNFANLTKNNRGNIYNRGGHLNAKNKSSCPICKNLLRTNLPRHIKEVHFNQKRNQRKMKNLSKVEAEVSGLSVKVEDSKEDQDDVIRTCLLCQTKFKNKSSLVDHFHLEHRIEKSDAIQRLVKRSILLEDSQQTNGSSSGNVTDQKTTPPKQPKMDEELMKSPYDESGLCPNKQVRAVHEELELDAKFNAPEEVGRITEVNNIAAAADNDRMQCCGMEFDDERGFELHLRELHLNRTETIITIQPGIALEEHGREEKGEAKHQPKENERTSTGVKCSECSDIFSSKWTLQHHRKMVHGKGKIIECQNCFKKMFRNREMTSHTKICPALNKSPGRQKSATLRNTEQHQNFRVLNLDLEKNSCTKELRSGLAVQRCRFCNRYFADFYSLNHHFKKCQSRKLFESKYKDLSNIRHPVKKSDKKKETVSGSSQDLPKVVPSEKIQLNPNEQFHEQHLKQHQVSPDNEQQDGRSCNRQLQQQQELQEEQEGVGNDNQQQVSCENQQQVSCEVQQQQEDGLINDPAFKNFYGDTFSNFNFSSIKYNVLYKRKNNDMVPTQQVNRSQNLFKKRRNNSIDKVRVKKERMDEDLLDTPPPPPPQQQQDQQQLQKDEQQQQEEEKEQLEGINSEKNGDNVETKGQPSTKQQQQQEGNETPREQQEGCTGEPVKASCITCGKMFASNHSLKRHIKQKHL